MRAQAVTSKSHVRQNRGRVDICRQTHLPPLCGLSFPRLLRPAGGFVCSTSATRRGDGSGRLVSFHRRASRKPRTCGASGLKKRLPSKCFGNSGVPSSSGEPVWASFNKLSAYNFWNHRQDDSSFARSAVPLIAEQNPGRAKVFRRQNGFPARMTLESSCGATYTNGHARAITRIRSSRGCRGFRKPGLGSPRRPERRHRPWRGPGRLRR